MPRNATLLDCGHPESPHSAITRGYGTDAEGKTHCYTCCANRDKAQMAKDGRITLYLCPAQSDTMKRVLSKAPTEPLAYLANWPGSFRIPVHRMRHGHHNVARTRIDVWFTYEGVIWHGVQLGEWTQLCHCKRTKQKVGA